MSGGILAGMTAATVAWMLAENRRVSPANPMFADAVHRNIGSTLTARTAIDCGAVGAIQPAPGAVLGQHADEVTADVLGVVGRDRRPARRWHSRRTGRPTNPLTGDL